MSSISLDLECFIVKKECVTFLGFVIDEKKDKKKFLTETYLLDTEKYYSLFKQTNVPTSSKKSIKMLNTYQEKFGILTPSLKFEEWFLDECKQNKIHPYSYYLYGLKRKKKKFNHFKKVPYHPSADFFNDYFNKDIADLVLLADSSYGLMIQKQLKEADDSFAQAIELLDSIFTKNSFTYIKFYDTILSVQKNINNRTSQLLERKYYEFHVPAEDFLKLFNDNNILLSKLETLKTELLEIKNSRLSQDDTIVEIEKLIDECKYYKKET